MVEEFDEIAHSGGQAFFLLKKDAEGSLGLQAGHKSSRPVPSVLIGVYALPQGVAVSSLPLGGWGATMDHPPIPGCYPVFIASDSQGKFGHNCPRCNGYWRSGPWPNVCPYCACIANGHEFLSNAQQHYVKHYCDTLSDALNSETEGEIVIDMDEVADAVGKENKPDFYISEKSQQCKFTCMACDEFNDILGRFGYCSLCGTRNDLAELQATTIPAIYKRLNEGQSNEGCLRDAVASLDTFVSQYARQLAELIPLIEHRRSRLQTKRYHNLKEVDDSFTPWFGIRIFNGIGDDDQQFAIRMFLRRHLHEHNGSEVDQRYLDESEDTTVVLKQHIRESKEDVERLLPLLLKVGRNIHKGFHQLLPPRPEPIAAFEDKKARIAKYSKQRN